MDTGDVGGQPSTGGTAVPVLEGRVSVITGAGQGLGRAFAQRLAASGSRVVIADINAERAAAVAAEIGPLAVGIPVDVADPASVDALRDRVVDELGRCDVLVNNAAIFSTIVMKPFDQIGPEEWARVMAVNVNGAYFCCRAFAPVMRSQAAGKIINISSGTVFEGRPNYAHYVTSKAAVIGLTRALARELGECGVTVNAVAPGATETEVPRATVTAAQVPLILARQSLKRREQASDVAGVVHFLAGPDSDFMTGQTLIVDGGTSFN
jgi:3-oxoacyl-[acyl-carrier protein] reductase